jgi:hypothetical protein
MATTAATASVVPTRTRGVAPYASKTRPQITEGKKTRQLCTLPIHATVDFEYPFSWLWR